MVPMLDVFAVNEGKPKWLDCTETVSKALELIRKRGKGSYILFSVETGYKDFYEVSPSGVVSQASSPRHWTA